MDGLTGFAVWFPSSFEDEECGVIGERKSPAVLVIGTTWTCGEAMLPRRVACAWQEDAEGVSPFLFATCKSVGVLLLQTRYIQSDGLI